MRPLTMLLAALAAVAVSLAVYLASGGHVMFFFLPLLFALPMLGRRR